MPEMELHEESSELLDPELEGQGLLRRLGLEESFKLAWRKGTERCCRSPPAFMLG